MTESKSCDHCGAGPDEPCPVGCTCGETDTIARLTRERDEARAAYASASREWAERHEHARERILGLTGELDAARRELHRLTHGEDIEGDGACRHEIDAQAARAERDEANARCARQADEITRLRDVVRGYMASHGERHVRLLHALIGQSVRERDTARRWSRLWHREARRLWREVQALSEHVEVDQ